VSWYFACSIGFPVGNTDKKTMALASPEPAQDTEGLLLDRLKNSKTDEDYFRWMLFVVGFYRGVNKIESAINLLEGYIRMNKNPEQSAHCHLALGQIAIDEQRLEPALKHFTAALEMAPKKRKVSYVLHNNIGYCLNSLGRFAEGEKYCRRAIEMDWVRASGYRNLGMSLKGQGDLIGAVWALAEAVKADGADNRAQLLLDQLLVANPKLGIQCPWATESMAAAIPPLAELPLM
jgi:tetratricopeptide (TPR) repeat protein